MKIITIFLLSLLLYSTYSEAHPLNKHNKSALGMIVYSALATELGLLSVASASVSQHSNHEWAPVFNYGAYGFGVAATVSAFMAITNYYDLSAHLDLHESNHSFPDSEN